MTGMRLSAAMRKPVSAISMTMVVASFTLLMASTSNADLYGTPWASDTLSNVNIRDDWQVSVRFTAKQSGTFDKAKFYFIMADQSQVAYCPAHPGSCYGHGTGGNIKIQLQTDDGTGDHFPSGTVLSETTVVEPKINHTNTGSPIYAILYGGPYASFPLIDMPNVSITSGQIYHLVFSNTDADPNYNYISLDHHADYGNYANDPRGGDPNLASLWGLPWEKRVWAGTAEEIPVYEVYYADGSSQGNGYMESGWNFEHPIYGSTKKMRERFTVSGGNRTVSKVFVRAARIGNHTCPLKIRLQTSNGTLIRQGNIAAGAFPINTLDEYGRVECCLDWGSYTFSPAVTLNNGTTYDLIVSAPRATSAQPYRSYGIKPGETYGFSQHFTDGNFYFTTNGSTWQTEAGPTDMQMYFEE